MAYLSLAIWLPIAFGAVIIALGRDNNANVVRWLALVGALVSFLITLPLVGNGFDLATPALQFQENLPWIERFNVRYHLGVDGISVWFVLLTAFITIIVVIAAWEVITERVHQYMGAFLILSGLMVGVFCAADGLLFYVFFEATLIPMYIIIGVWGGPRRVYAAFKFFLYTLAGSLLMLIALIFLYIKSGGSFDLAVWHQPPSPSRCRCGRCIPGCLTRTSRRPPVARSCWRPSCSSSVATASCVSRCRSRLTQRTTTRPSSSPCRSSR
jgi:NADH-quinone oxidoreductase subunit M